jgi:hypothetical protein
MDEQAIDYAQKIILRSTDWQEVQHALANHRSIGPWLRARMTDDDDLSEIQAIIREAEERLGDDLPLSYG